MKKLFFPILSLLYYLKSASLILAASAKIAECGKGSWVIDTAIGEICTDAANGGFIEAILSTIVGLGGGIALLLMLYGIFLITTSAGIPDKLNQGKQIIESAIGGLIFIVLSIVLLQLVGVKILAIPGL
jgi:hypothetical protein